MQAGTRRRAGGGEGKSEELRGCLVVPSEWSGSLGS